MNEWSMDKPEAVSGYVEKASWEEDGFASKESLYYMNLAGTSKLEQVTGFYQYSK